MVKKFAPGHSHKGRGELQTLTETPRSVPCTIMTKLPSCTFWLLLWSKNSLIKILSCNLESQIEEDFLKCHGHS